MQLTIRGQNTHILRCNGIEKVAELRASIAALENLPSGAAIQLYSGGSPLEDDARLPDLRSTAIDVTVPVAGGKVHGSLARAGKVKRQTPIVEKKERTKKEKTGRARQRQKYNKRVVVRVNKRRCPDSNQWATPSPRPFDQLTIAPTATDASRFHLKPVSVADSMLGAGKSMKSTQMN